MFQLKEIGFCFNYCVVCEVPKIRVDSGILPAMFFI